MSWSVTLIGKPQDIANALDKKLEEEKNSTTQAEYKEAFPLLKEILAKNHGSEYTRLKLTASGSWSTYNNEKTQGSLYVNVEYLYGEIV